MVMTKKSNTTYKLYRVQCEFLPKYFLVYAFIRQWVLHPQPFFANLTNSSVWPYLPLDELASVANSAASTSLNFVLLLGTLLWIASVSKKNILFNTYLDQSTCLLICYLIIQFSYFGKNRALISVAYLLILIILWIQCNRIKAAYICIVRIVSSLYFLRNCIKYCCIFFWRYNKIAQFWHPVVA